MNQNQHNQDAFGPPDGGREGMTHLDADLVSLCGALDGLGASERGGAEALEDRVMQASLTSLGHVRAMSASLGELGAVERAGGPKTLERDVFLASRTKLRELAGARVHAGAAGRSVPATGRRVWMRPMRLAAVVLLAMTAGIVVLAVVQQSNRSRELAMRTPEQLSEQIRGEMDVLFAVLDERSQVGEGTDAASDGEAQTLIEWLSEGAAS